MEPLTLLVATGPMAKEAKERLRAPGGDGDGQVAAPSMRVEISMRLSEFRLPPVQSALVIGRRAPVGPRAMYQALQAMLPGVYRLVEVDHPVVEAMVFREADLRRVREQLLVTAVLSQASAFMTETDVLHCALDLVITTHTAAVV